MKQTGEIDQDDVLRARTLLLRSGRLTVQQEVDAYRVLAQVSPAAYLPRLVKALHRLAYDASRAARHPDSIALYEEAVGAARAMDPGDPHRTDLLYTALDSYQRELYIEDRRAEGLAVRGELVALGRAEAERTGDPVVRGLGAWGVGLADAGRFDEAADALGEWVAASGPRPREYGRFTWWLLEWTAALADAGRVEEALAAFRMLVERRASAGASGEGPSAGHLQALIGYARLLDDHGRAGQAAAVRQEALGLLTELARRGGRKTWRTYQRTLWAVLMSFGDADRDRARRGIDDGSALRAQVRVLAADGARSAELVRLHQVLARRAAAHWDRHSTPDPARMLEILDEGVELARGQASADGGRALAEALVDRASFGVAVGEYGPALVDFRTALPLF